jgi:Protein kinase domain
MSVTSQPRRLEDANTLRLAGRYELLGNIGEGGMGVVYRAVDRVLDRIVAVKVLPVGSAMDESVVARFEREARAAASLSHPNIVAVFDAGSEDATHFIVMEFVSGVSLAERLHHPPAIPVAHVVGLAAQIAGGLAAAHRAGIVHRDIKPSNVMVDQSGIAKLLDFGIARAHASTSLTRTGSVLGSAHYIAPEVARGEPAEERSDVYSLGCMLYEMLTGRPPFVGDLDVAVLQQHASAHARPPRALDPAVPCALDELTMQLLAKRADDRPRASQVEQALGRSLRAGATARAPRPAGRRGWTRQAEPTHVLTRTPPRYRSRLGITAVMVAALVGLGLALGVAESPSRSGSREAPAEASGLSRDRARQLGPLIPGASGIVDGVTKLVMTAAADVAAAAPAPSSVPQPPKKAGKKKSKMHSPRGRGRRADDRKQAAAPTEERRDEPPLVNGEGQTPAASGEPEAPATGAETTTPTLGEPKTETTLPEGG